MSTALLVNGHSNGTAPMQVGLETAHWSSPWVVQKFGGTSVGKFPVNIVEDIVRATLKSNRVAIVCSARSTGKKVEGTTSRLLELFKVLQELSLVKDEEAVHYQTLCYEYERLVRAICDDHIGAAKQYILNTSYRDIFVADIEAECRDISDLREVTQRFRLEIDSRSKDRIISFGEKLSCRFMTALLQDRGVDAEYIDLSDVINFKTDPSLGKEFYAKLVEVLKDKVMACGNKTPVITGYFGTVPGGLIDGEIGRGYTDLCAALVAVGLKAKELQVWKEVDGIFTADPTKVPSASLLTSITPAEAAELTFYGSEVIHHLTMDQVIHATPPIQIRIKNVKNPRGNGTIIVPDPVLASGQAIMRRTRSDQGARRIPKRPTAVTIKDKIFIINVHSNKRSISHGFFLKIFSILDNHRISVDLISTSEVHVSMAIHSANLSEREIEDVRLELEQCGEVSMLYKMAILSLVGAEMKNMPGIAGKMFSALGEHDINLEMISQGASEINISCVIEAHEANRAMNILHTNLFTFLE